MFTPMDADEQAVHFREHCEQIETDKAVCYCKFCADGINMGGKTGVHLLELLFPGAAGGVALHCLLVALGVAPLVVVWCQQSCQNRPWTRYLHRFSTLLH